jgi:hypothetical protein
MKQSTEREIWHRLIDPCWKDLSPAAAKDLLRLKFQSAGLQRMNELATLARSGTLSEKQREELEIYSRIGRMFAVIQAKARMVLKRSKA